MAAIAAAETGAEVVVFEQMQRPGLKLLASGGGKCNLTNVLPVREMAARFGASTNFILPALRRLSNDDLLEFFITRGVSFSAQDGFHYFPDSGKASDILAVLLAECDQLNVKINCGQSVSGLDVDNGAIRGVIAGGKNINCNSVIIACGGMGYPRLGGNESGYDLARQAGHEIVTPLPGLTGVKAAEDWPGQCAGISLNNVTAVIALPGENKRHELGELLFTHHGVSGPAIINLAGRISILLQNTPSVPININLFADRDAEYWQGQFNDWQRQHGKKLVKNLLPRLVPATLAEIICRLAGCESIKAAEFNIANRNKMITLLTTLPLQINAVEDWDKAMVTHGGVALQKINPQTLESNLTRGLFFAGEVLDIAGPCGGFNLQWAFSSGHLAGAAVAAK
jgi:predicted Rossmann fold flavoprotein